MTQRTINLYDGLEALYYMDPTYFDGTAGEIKDKSGHGRHAQASGGPTVGVEGPDSFEATSFDGTDDYFDSVTISSDYWDEITIATLFKMNEAKSIDTAIFGLRYTARIVNNSNGEYEARVRDSNGDNVGTDMDDTIVNDYLLGILRYDGETVKTNLNGKTNVNSAPTGFENSKDRLIRVGGPNLGSSSGNLNGNIVFSGIWNREITDAEIEHLNRLTAPRRAQL